MKLGVANPGRETVVAARQGGAAAAAHPAAVAAAQAIASSGGNAVDAAAAAAWALSVCEPAGSGLGGQSVALLRLADGKIVVIDGHSRAPAAVSPATVTASQQRQGYRAGTVPSTVATLGLIQLLYGRLSLARVIEPAIHLAEEGFPITPLQRQQLEWHRSSLNASPVTRRLFLSSGEPPHPGECLRQPELAETLRRIARFGPEEFYHGGLARDIVQDMTDNDGLIVREDLRRLELPTVNEPVGVDYQNYRVLSVAPPGGGTQVLLGLKILQCLDRHNDAGSWYENLARTTRLVFQTRERLGIRPDQNSSAALEWLLSDEHVREIVSSLSPPNRWPDGGDLEEASGETTHLCTADSQGNMVALTQSIQSLFGAKAANARLGFLYNNYLKTCPRCSHPYQLGPRCRPRSNAAPLLVLRKTSGGANGDKDWAPFLLLGAAGSRRITSALLQVISAVLDRRMGLAEALVCPRIHGQENGMVRLERSAVTDPLRRDLSRNARKLLIQAPLSYSMGSVQAIQFQANGHFIAAADPRRDGTAALLDFSERKVEKQEL